jgi:ABC-type lipoprotein export system ATPase subunit
LKDKVDMSLSLVCQNVSLSRRCADGIERTILEQIDATLTAGEGTLISGKTGAGKSTLLHLLAGLLRPSQGQIIANGQPVSRWHSAHLDLWRRQVGIVFQQPHLIKEFTVLENVILPMIPRGASITQLRKLARETLDTLGISHLAKQNVRTLSGGEQQRVSIARALVSRPAILIADEPTAHQDDDGAALIIEILTGLKLPHTIIIVAAHDSRWAHPEKFADKHFLLENGRLKERQ